MRIVGDRQQDTMGGFGLIAPRFGFEKVGSKYRLLKLKEGLELSSNNLEYEDYSVEFDKFSELPKEVLIEIFESEYKDWFINRLDELYSKDTSGLNENEQIVLKICMSFPETFYKLQTGEKCGNGYAFKKGCMLLGMDEDLIGDFYGKVRCGLYHFGSLGGGRNIDYECDEEKNTIDKVIYEKSGHIKCICLTKFISKIKESINDYIDKLKNDDNLYDIFTKKYVNDLNTYLKGL